MQDRSEQWPLLRTSEPQDPQKWTVIEVTPVYVAYQPLQ